MLDAPLCFVPHLRPMVWGGRRLAERLGKPLPTADSYGESWEISDHPHHRSVVAHGPHAGQTLRQLMERDRSAVVGPKGPAVFPWLVKFLDASDWLSVQVHPDERHVERLWPGEGSKTEAWFVLDAGPDSRIYAGLRPGTDEARLRAALKAGTVAECLHSFGPRAGDCVFLPAGTVHALGGGVLLAEVQQTSDATFRLFDWNRRDAQGNARKLHIEEGLACIDWGAGPVQPVRAAAFEGRGGVGERQSLVRCPYFVLEYVRAREAIDLGCRERLQVLIVLQGRGRLTGHHGEEDLRPGQSWLLPAALAPVRCVPEPDLGAFLCTLPTT